MKRLIPLMGMCALLSACTTYTRWDKDFEQAPEPVRTDWTLTKQRCGGCHSMEKVFLQMKVFKDRGDIELAVEDMAHKRGSGIRQHEIATITDTLEWYRAKE